MLPRLKYISIRFLMENWFIALIIVIFFMAGIIFGALGAKTLDHGIKTELSDTVSNYLKKVPGYSLSGKEVVKDLLLRNLYIIICMYILGLSVIGAVLVPILVFTRGFTLGFTIGFLTYDQAWKGALLSLVSVMPQNIIYIPTLLVSGVLTVSFSILFIRGRMFFREFESRRPILFYSLGMLTALCITSLGSLLEAYVTPYLIKYTTALLY